jgi:hypothetical protein
MPTTCRKGYPKAASAGGSISSICMSSYFQSEVKDETQDINLIMTLRCLIWGIGCILFPGKVWFLSGLSFDYDNKYISSELGTLFFMLGIILWSAKKDSGSQALRAIVLGLFIGNALGFVVTLIGQFSTGISALGWVGALMYFLLTLGFGYYAIKSFKPGSSSR